jgi:hypothetical protein
MLLEFSQKRDEVYYSERLGVDFIEKTFNILQKDFEGRLKQSEVQNLRVIRMLGDFQLHGSVLRRYYKHKEILHSQYFIEVISNFKQHCIEKEYSIVTIGHYTKQSARFLDYCDSHGLTSCNEINLTLIYNYIKTLAGYAYKTMELQLCSLRSFFKYLYLNNMTNADYSLEIPMVQSRKQTRIPSVWSVDDLKKLISSIDRGSPMGKRDYAMILLACRLGPGPTHLNSRAADLSLASLLRLYSPEPQFLVQGNQSDQGCVFKKTEGHSSVTYSQLRDFAVFKDLYRRYLSNLYLIT